MKGLICAFAIVLIISGQAGATEPLAALYNRGNEYYRDGNFDAAISAYERVIAQGLNNGEVYYNLGSAYYKSGQLGRAILSYERALKLVPGDADILANLRFVNALKVDRESEDDANVLTQVLRAVFAFFSLNALAVLVSVFVFVLGGVIVGWLFVPERRVLWVGMLILLGMGILGSGSMLAFKAHQRNIPEAVVLEDEVIGRSGPGSDFLQVFTLHEGTKVIVERAEGVWLLVRLRSGLGGWVDSKSVDRI